MKKFQIALGLLAIAFYTSSFYILASQPNQDVHTNDTLFFLFLVVAMAFTAAFMHVDNLRNGTINNPTKRLIRLDENYQPINSLEYE